MQTSGMAAMCCRRANTASRCTAWRARSCSPCKAKISCGCGRRREAEWTFPEYDQPDVYFPSGLQAVYDIDGTRLAGYLDESGELAIPLQFSFVTQFYGKLAYVGMVQDDGTTQYGYINQQGEWVYSWTE